MPTWSTGAVPRKRQFTYWREMICEAFLDLTPESRLRDGFRGKVTQQSLGLLNLARIDSQAQRVRRTVADIARSPRAGHYANVQVRGVCLTTQDGRATVQHPGDIAVINTSRPFAFEFSDDFQQLSLHIPGQLLQAQLEQPIRTATRIATTTGVGAAVRHALHAIDLGHHLEPAAAARLAVHTCGLLAVALDRPVPAAAGVRRHGRLLDAALDDIDEHLADDDLCPTVTAGRLGISVRLLHQVFTGHERTFTSEIRRRRIEQAHHDLKDPARAALRISDIAADAGFADVTHFHRVFRERYGDTPAQVRRDAGVATPTLHGHHSRGTESTII
jgi:AraC family transcriptional regulator, positive regulator of tynA and feaB